MIGVIVTFHYSEGVDADAVTRIAQAAGERFRGMPGLRSKAFTVDGEAGEAVNFYVWDDEDAARAFFDEALVERVTGLYGVRPSVRFVQIAELVDNSH
jgi:Putative mono-oxygenase ydhR